MIIEELLATDDDQQGWTGGWRMSSIGGCPRARLAEATGKMMLSGQLIAAREGHLHEADLVRRLKAKGYRMIWTGEEQKAVHLTWQGKRYPISGHPDGLILLPPFYLFEAKSKDHGSFSMLKKYGNVQTAFPQEFAQIMFYLHSDEVREFAAAQGIEITACLYICKNRGSGKLYEEIIRKDTDWFNQFMMDVFQPLIAARDSGADPSTLECSQNDYIKRWCPFRYFCEGDTAELPEVDDIKATEAMSRYRQAKQMADDAEEMLEPAKAEIRAFLIQNNIDKAFIDGAKVQLISGDRETVDTKLLRSELPDEELKKYLKISPYEQLRITT